MEVWLLETYYIDNTSFEDRYEEIFLHCPDSDIWITDVGLSEEMIESCSFTHEFWKNKDNEHLFTRLGEL